MPFQIVHNDITRMHTDAIVNAANEMLREGGGVCGAIFRAAGSGGLAQECRRKAPCPTGQAVITGGYGLAARYIIHAVGPVWQGGGHGEAEALAGAYRQALLLAAEYGCESVSFPLISSGIYGYPKEQALQVATGVIREFLQEHEMEVYLVVFDRGAVSVSERLFAEVRHYVDTYYEPEPGRTLYWNGPAEAARMPQPEYFDAVFEAPSDAGSWENDADEEDEHVSKTNRLAFWKKDKKKSSRKAVLREEESGTAPAAPHASLPASTAASASHSAVPAARKLEELLAHMDESFSEMLLRLIDEKGYTDVEVYKRANMDRKLFSKIRGNKEYHPKKATVLALAVALRLSEDETVDLLQRAGYSFSGSCRQDIIVRYFLQKGEYDMFTINETLFCFEEPLLGA